MGDGLGVVAIVPVHGGDAVQLLHAQHGAQVVGDLLQRLLVLLVDHQESHRLQVRTRHLSNLYKQPSSPRQ